MASPCRRFLHLAACAALPAASRFARAEISSSAAAGRASITRQHTDDQDYLFDGVFGFAFFVRFGLDLPFG